MKNLYGQNYQDLDIIKIKYVANDINNDEIQHLLY